MKINFNFYVRTRNVTGNTPNWKSPLVAGDMPRVLGSRCECELGRHAMHILFHARTPRSNWVLWGMSFLNDDGNKKIEPKHTVSSYGFLWYSNGSVRVDYEVMFNSTAANLTSASLNTELEKAVNNTNGTIGNSLVLGPLAGNRLFVVEGMQVPSL